MRCSAASQLHKLLAVTFRALGAPAVPPSQALAGCAAPAENIGLCSWRTLDAGVQRAHALRVLRPGRRYLLGSSAPGRCLSP